MLAEDAISQTGGLYGLIGLVVTGFFGVAVAWVRGRKGKHEDEGEGEAERAATELLLEFIEDNTIRPLRQDHDRIREQRDRLLDQLEECNRARQRLETQLADRERQMSQLLGRDAYERTNRSRSTPRTNRNGGDAGGSEEDPSEGATPTAHD